MDQVKKLYALEHEGPHPPLYTDAQNILFEYACFLRKKDNPLISTFNDQIFNIPNENERTYWNGWLKQIHYIFKKEFPEITREKILKILKNPKDENVAYELLSVAPFELLEEFYTKLTRPPVSSSQFNYENISITNLILSTQKKAPQENIIMSHNIPINN